MESGYSCYPEFIQELAAVCGFFTPFLAIHAQICHNQGLINITIVVGCSSANREADLLLKRKVIVDFFEVVPQPKDGLV
jgi:hypothetical protein